ncbi:Fasciclin-domain-containing protein [Imleria badia]|nr:Fasciclin-domain-containing protein [Imleria badia]
MFACALTVSAFALVPSVLAEGNLTGLLQALNSSGLDQFANATASLNGTTTGRQVLTQLFRGNNTIFAPTDDACVCLSGVNTANETCLADIISYHIVTGNLVNETQTYPNVTIGRTLLNDSSEVTLEGNQSQVLVWSKSDNGSLFVMNQGSNITVVNTTSYNDTAILAIDSVLTAPPNISAVLNNSIYDLTTLASLLQSASLLNGSSVLDALSSAHGITLFAPNNAGVQAAQGSLAGISKNATALQNDLSNHVINGTSVYSTEISNGSRFTSAAGQNLVFSVNYTGFFVSVGGSNQVQIVEPNVLTSNGVIHIVNGVMLDTNSNAAAASSAFASATSVAAHSATATGAVSVGTTTPTSTSTPTSGGRAKGGANRDNWKMGAVVGMVVGFGQFV